MARFDTRNKKMIIKGAGKFMAKLPGCDELITLGTMTNMRLDIQLDMQDIEGGDTSVPLDTLLRKKVIDITAEDAKFDLNMVRLVLGSKLKEGVTGAPYKYEYEQVILQDAATPDQYLHATLSQAPLTSPVTKVFLATGQEVDQAAITVSGNEIQVDKSLSGLLPGTKVTVYYPVAVPADKIDPDGYVWVLEEKHSVENGKIKLAFGHLLYGQTPQEKQSHISVRTIRENKLLKKGEDYTVDTATGEITFNGLDKIDVYVNYKRYEVVDVLDIARQDFPLTVTIVHDGVFEQKDGTLQGYQIELYACRVKSNFTIDAQRQQASTHAVTLTVIDPERVDGKLGTIKRYEVVNPNVRDVC